ncbi:MAG: tetratricopeptide repeat protein [Isosphaerales bacterium]
MLDNVSEPGLLEPEYLDRQPRDRKVDPIATTRLAPARIPGSAQDQTFIAVDELPEDDALALLRSHQPDGRFPSQAEDDEARAIARLLEGFTLAVETTAIYLGRHPGSDSCRRLRERLRTELLAESETSAGDPSVAVRHRERLLATTLEPTFETLSPEAIHLLTLASLLPADAIALPWLQAVAAQQIQAFRPTVDLLQGLRLFQATEVADSGGEQLVARMHRLVQEVVKKRWPDDLAARERALLDHIRARADFLWEGWVRHEHRWELAPLTACADRWLEHEGDDGPWLASHVAGPLQALGNFAGAERLNRRALERTRPDHGNFAARLNNLAELLRTTNRLAEAEPLLRRALATSEASLGADHPLVATELNNLAVLLQATNRLTEAEPLFRRALAIDEAAYGRDHPDVARDLNNLAGLLRASNRLAEAEPPYRRAVEVLLKFTHATGHEHPHFRTFTNNYAGLLAATGLSNAQIEARLNEIGRPFGMLLAGGAPPGNETRPG